MDIAPALRSDPSRSGEIAVIAARARIAGLDVARAFALLGMMAVDFESVLSNQLGPPWLERVLQLPEGFASALFVVLAGIGATFLAGSDPRRASLVLVRRALVLLLLGYFFLAMAWEEDILHFYGYYFLIAVPCLWLPNRGLLLALVLALMPTPLLLSRGWDFDQGWVLDHLEYVDLWTPRGHLRHLFFNGFFSIPSWIALFLWGMWLGRHLLEERTFLFRAARWGLVVFVTVELSSILLGGRFGWLSTAGPMPPLPGHMISAGALATALLGACEFLAVRRGETLLVRVFAHGGQAALSLYLLHIIVGIGPFDLWYQLGCLTRPQVFTWWVVFSYLAFTAAHQWRLRFAQGPFEALYRALGGPVRGDR